MKCRKTLIISVMAILLLLPLLSWAAGQGESGKSKEQSAKISFMMRGGKRQLKFYREILNKFTGEHPNIKVNLLWAAFAIDEYFEKIQLASVVGKGADVFWLNTKFIPFYARKGMLKDLNTFIKTDTIDMSIYYPKSIEAATFDGKLTGFPRNGNPGFGAIFYNKDVFDASGLAYPKEDWGWDDLRNLAGKTAKHSNGAGKTNRWGIANLASENGALNVLESFGGGYVDRSGKKSLLGTKESIEAVKFIVSLIKDKTQLPVESDLSSISGFGSGQIAMMIGGYGYIANLRSYAKGKPFNWDVQIVPTGKAGKVSSASVWAFYSMLANTKQPEASWELIKFLGSRATEKAWNDLGGLPCVIPEIVDNSPLMDFQPYANFMKLFKYAKPYPVPANLRTNEVRDVINSGLEEIWYLKKDPATGCRELNGKVQKVLDKEAP